MTQYEQALIAMKQLLSTVGESHWAQWLEQDIRDWRAARDTTHHRSAYGGMGSFNDIWICRANSHAVSEAQEPWVNALFEWLKALCYFLVSHPSETFAVRQLAQHIGRRDSSLAAFVGGDRAPASMRGYVTDDPKLQGWRCLRCGHSEVSSKDIETLLAQDLVPHTVFDSCEHSALSGLVDQILNRDIPRLEAIHECVDSAVAASGIVHNDRDGWMRPCPKCGRDDTAVYRWRLKTNGGWHFDSSDDNVAMRQ